jgi:hypothetical protein
LHTTPSFAPRSRAKFSPPYFQAGAHDGPIFSDAGKVAGTRPGPSGKSVIAEATTVATCRRIGITTGLLDGTA